MGCSRKKSDGVTVNDFRKKILEMLIKNQIGVFLKRSCEFQSGFHEIHSNE